MKKWHIHIVVGLLMMALFLSLIIWPIVSNHVYEQLSNQQYIEFSEVVSGADDTSRAEALAQARNYNASLASGTYAGFTQETIDSASVNYYDMLSIDGSKTMAYLSIPAINVHLPIVHGTDNEALSSGIGHLIGTSLPVGGENTHCVISGHTGVATNRLLTDLDRVVIGDRFDIDVMGESLHYRVVQIDIVEPWDTSLLRIYPGKDYVTIITCTPYGVNSHRLLVRGERVVTSAQNEQKLNDTAADTNSRGSTWRTEYFHGIGIGTAAAVLIIAVAILAERRKHHA